MSRVGIVGVNWLLGAVLNTHKFLCQKFATVCQNSVKNFPSLICSVCRKVTIFCPAYFFNPRHRC